LRFYYLQRKWWTCW